MRILILILLLQTNVSSFATSVEGVNFPEEIVIANEKLLLNGVALRKATIFGLKILVVGLYLNRRMSQSKDVLALKSTKKIQIRFLKSISGGRLSKMWAKEILARCAKNCHELKAQVSQLGKMMVDVKSGDSLQFTFVGEQVHVQVKDSPVAIISGNGFALTLLSLWIGPNPLNEAVKEGLLGVTDS